MLIELPGAIGDFVNPDNISSISAYKNTDWPDRRSFVAMTNGGVLYSSLHSAPLFVHLNEIIYRHE